MIAEFVKEIMKAKIAMVIVLMMKVSEQVMMTAVSVLVVIVGMKLTVIKIVIMIVLARQL